MPVIPAHILFAYGGDVLQKYGTLFKRYAPPSRGGETPYTFVRTGTGATAFVPLQPNVLGVVSHAANVPRVDWLVDPVSSQLQPYWLFEPAATNTLLQSQALNTTPWSPVNLTVTNNVLVAPDLTTTGANLVPTATPTAAHRDQQNYTITANENVAFSCFVKANGYPAVRLQIVDAATALNGFVLRFDATAGAYGTNALVGTGTLTGTVTPVALGNSWWWIGGWGTLGGGITAATLLVDVFDTLAHANSNSAWSGDTTSGVSVWGAQLERGGTSKIPPSRYIATTTGTAGRGTEHFGSPHYVAPQVGLWVYSRFIERGAAFQAAFRNGPWQLGSTTPIFYSISEAGNGSPGFYGLELWSSASVSSICAPSPTAMGAVSVGQVIEHLAIITGNPAVQFRQSINGAAETVGTASGNALGLPLPAQWGSLQLGIDIAATANPGVAVSRVIGGLGGSALVPDIPTARAIPV